MLLQSGMAALKPAPSYSNLGKFHEPNAAIFSDRQINVTQASRRMLRPWDGIELAAKVLEEARTLQAAQEAASAERNRAVASSIPNGTGGGAHQQRARLLAAMNEANDAVRAAAISSSPRVHPILQLRDRVENTESHIARFVGVVGAELGPLAENVPAYRSLVAESERRGPEASSPPQRRQVPSATSPSAVDGSSLVVKEAAAAASRVPAAGVGGGSRRAGSALGRRLLRAASAASCGRASPAFLVPGRPAPETGLAGRAPGVGQYAPKYGVIERHTPCAIVTKAAAERPGHQIPRATAGSSRADGDGHEGNDSSSPASRPASPLATVIPRSASALGSSKRGVDGNRDDDPDHDDDDARARTSLGPRPSSAFASRTKRFTSLYRPISALEASRPSLWPYVNATFSDSGPRFSTTRVGAGASPVTATAPSAMDYRGSGPLLQNRADPDVGRIAVKCFVNMSTMRPSSAAAPVVSSAEKTFVAPVGRPPTPVVTSVDVGEGCPKDSLRQRLHSPVACDRQLRRPPPRAASPGHVLALGAGGIGAGHVAGMIDLSKMVNPRFPPSRVDELLLVSSSGGASMASSTPLNPEFTAVFKTSPAWTIASKAHLPAADSTAQTATSHSRRPPTAPSNLSETAACSTTRSHQPPPTSLRPSTATIGDARETPVAASSSPTQQRQLSQIIAPALADNTSPIRRRPPRCTTVSGGTGREAPVMWAGRKDTPNVDYDVDLQSIRPRVKSPDIALSVSRAQRDRVLSPPDTKLPTADR